MAPLFELALAQIVRYDDEMQLVLGAGTIQQLTEPGTLLPCVRGKVEDDRHAFGEERAYVWRQRILDPGRVLHEGPEVDDFAGIQGRKHVVLCKKDSVFL